MMQAEKQKRKKGKSEMCTKEEKSKLKWNMIQYKYVIWSMQTGKWILKERIMRIKEMKHKKIGQTTYN